MRSRVRATVVSRPLKESIKLPAILQRKLRSSRQWCRDLRTGTAFAALFALGLVSAVPSARAQDVVLPSGAKVTHGNATLSGSGNSLLINQTSGSAIINWNSFSIGSGGATHFNNGSGATLNRVTGNVPSQIDGSLTATGSLFLVNQAGVVVGNRGMVATGGTFAASTQNVSDADFLNGGNTAFVGNSKAQIVNHGTISSAMGDVALIARRVENTGNISAPNGTAALLAGYDVLMRETNGANGRFAVRTGGSDTEVVNSGTINAAEVELRANGGNVLALAGNTKGVIKATGVAKHGGRIFLTAGGGKVRAGGRISARKRVSSGSAKQSGGDVFINADAVLASGSIDVSGLGAAGGKIDIGGRNIALQGAKLDASGTTGGGRIRVGGAFQGGDFGNLDTALLTSIDAASVLRANATSGDGGEVIVWSDKTTNFNGHVSATGVNGGLAEVSGKVNLGFTGVVDLHGTTGADGTLLLDPTDFTIGVTEALSITTALGGANVVVSTSAAGGGNGDIVLNNAVIYSSGNSLSFLAHRDISLNASVINSGVGALNFVAGWDGATQDPGASGVFSPGTFDIAQIAANAGSYGNSGDLILNSALTGKGATSMYADDIRFNGTTTGGQFITAVGKGNINLNTGSVMNLNTAGGGLDFTASQIRIDVPSVLTGGGGQQYRSTVSLRSRTLGDDSIGFFDIGGGDISFDAVLDAENSNDIDLIVTTSGLKTFGGLVGKTNRLQSLVVNGGGTTLISGGAVETRGKQDWVDAVILGADADLESQNDKQIQFFSTLNSAAATNFALTIDTKGETQFDGAVGSVRALGALTFDDTGDIEINAAGITTTGNQTYAGSVFVGADTTLNSGGAISFNSTVDSVAGGDFDLDVTATGDVTFNDKVGGVVPLGSLNVDAGGTTYVKNLVTTTGNQTYTGVVQDFGTVFNSLAGDLTFGGGIVAADPSEDLWLLAAGDINIGGSIQWNGAGDVTLVAGWNAATDGSSGWTLGGTTANTSILDNTGNYGLGTGDIFIGDGTQTGSTFVGSSSGTTTALARDLNLLASTVAIGRVQLGFNGAASGDINVALTRDLTATGGNLYGYALLGHGGEYDNHDHSGNISVEALGDINFSGGSSSYAWAQLGHGGYSADGNNSGAISVSADNMAFTGGALNFAYAHLGHGGADASGDQSGGITIALTGNLDLAGGGNAFSSYAQIGHGAADFSSTGTRMGDISAVIGGLTSFSDETGGAWFGHATTTSGGVSNANVALVTNGLNTTGIPFATTGLSDFAGMLQYNLLGGDVLIANRLAAATPDFGGPANQGFDDIIFTGSNFGYFTSPNDLTLIAGGDVVMLASMRNQGTGNINLVGGWNGTTGLDLIGFPMLDVAAVETAGAFGVTGGDVYIGDGSQTQQVDVGTRMGDIHVLAHDLEVRGSTTGVGDSARLGFRSGPVGGIDSDIRIVVMDDVIVEGGDADYTSATIGHDGVENSGSLRGNITIIGDTANDNLVAVLGGDGVGTYAQIGHEGLGVAEGDISITGQEVFVAGGDGDGSDAQIGHFAYTGATGDISIDASGSVAVQGGEGRFSTATIGHTTNGDASGVITIGAADDFAVIGGEGEYAQAQVGHFGENATGNISVDAGRDFYLIGGDDDETYATLGHVAAYTASGDINVSVAGDAVIAGGTDDETDAQVGHYADVSAAGDINFAVDGDMIIAGGEDDDSAAYIGHAGLTGSASGDIDIDVGGMLALWGGDYDDSWAQIGHSINDGSNSGQIDVNVGGALDMLAGDDDEAYAQIGHGDAAVDSSGTRQGDINVVVGGEATLEDGVNGLAWIGHGTTTAGGISNADVSIEAFGFDRTSASNVAAGANGLFNKDMLVNNIAGGDFTLIATGTGLLLEDPVYNSSNDVLISVNNDLVLGNNAVFVNSGSGDIVLAAGGSFHNDTGSATPIVTGGRWLVYSTRPDENRNDIEATNWDFLRYGTSFDINNPYVGTGNGFIYSVTPIVNFTVSNITTEYGGVIVPIITQTVTVNGVQVDADDFGLGINPATGDFGLAFFVTLDANGNPVVGFYDNGLTIHNAMLPYFGMGLTITPGDLTVVAGSVDPGDPQEPTEITDQGTFEPSNPQTAFASTGIGEMCAFHSDDEDPDEDEPSYDRIIELCGIIESDKD